MRFVAIIWPRVPSKLPRRQPCCDDDVCCACVLPRRVALDSAGRLPRLGSGGCVVVPMRPPPIEPRLLLASRGEGGSDGGGTAAVLPADEAVGVAGVDAVEACVAAEGREEEEDVVDDAEGTRLICGGRGRETTGRRLRRRRKLLPCRSPRSVGSDARVERCSPIIAILRIDAFMSMMRFAELHALGIS